MANYKIVISGYYGFNNAGDEAMLSAIIQSLRGTFDTPEITVISGSPARTSRVFDVKAIPRFGMFPIIKSIFRSDLIISGGGSLLQDVTSLKSMIYYLSIITLGVLFRKRVFLYSQGIGPVRYRVIRIVLKHVLNHVDVITVRDKESKGFLERLGVKRRIYTTADAVLSLHPPKLEPGRAILDEEGIPADKKIIGVAIRRWDKKYSWTNDLISYINKIASLKDYAVVFIPMQSPGDRVASEEIAGNFAKENIFRLQGGYTLDELISIIGNCNLIVGMRLHALIFSALMRVPFIGISYDPKIDNFLSLIGLEPGASVQHLDAEKLYNKTCHILEHGMPAEVWDSVQDLQHYAGENANILKRFVETKEETR